MGVARKTFRIDYPPSEALNVWSMNTYWVESSDVMIRVALLIYGSYKAFNVIKHKSISNAQQATECIKQACKYGAVGNDICMDIVDSSWSKPISHLC